MCPALGQSCLTWIIRFNPHHSQRRQKVFSVFFLPRWGLERFSNRSQVTAAGQGWSPAGNLALWLESCPGHAPEAPGARPPGPPSPLWGRIAGLPAEDLGHPAGNSRPAGGDTPPELVLQARGSKPPLRKIVSSKGLNSKWFHFPFP